jgi:hypothetical protein
LFDLLDFHISHLFRGLLLSCIECTCAATFADAGVGLPRRGRSSASMMIAPRTSLHWRERLDHQMPTGDVRVGRVHIRDAGFAGPMRVNVEARQFDRLAVCVHSNPPWQRYLIDR